MTTLERPRVGIDVTPAFDQGGGIGRYTRELVRALTMESDGYQFRLFSARPAKSLPFKYPVPTGENISFRSIPLNSRWMYRIWHRLRIPLPVQLFTGKIEVFHSPDFVLPPIWGSVPTLLTVHDLSFVHHPEAFTKKLVGYLNWTVPRSVRRATHVLADSQATKEDLIDLWNVEIDKITVLYSGVDSRFRPVESRKRLEAMRRKYKLGDSPYLLGVGTLQPRKNFQMLARAFGLVAKRHPHQLVIAGAKGWLYEQILTEVKSAGLTERVRFLGFVDDEDLPALYSGATLFLFPSLYEGFGLPILEAMSCGVPVLSSDASSLPEVVGKAGILLAPGDQQAWSEAIDSLIEDPIARTELVAAGFLQARKFRWRTSAKQLLKIYSELLIS